MTHIVSSITIDRPVDILWQVISNFGAAGDYLAGVIDCMVEGAGVGARRTLTSIDGSTVVERLEMLDAATQQLNYRLLTATPFGDCLTSMVVCNLGPNQAKLSWSASFEADGIPVNEAVALLEGMLADNCLALKRYVEDGWR